MIFFEGCEVGGAHENSLNFDLYRGDGGVSGIAVGGVYPALQHEAVERNDFSDKIIPGFKAL
ncbi:hypothetical protein LZK76_02220 [Rhizobium leguminosarum]|nr:hypothetical protein LZK76_02220 [Rhizobium leguminosarum]